MLTFYKLYIIDKEMSIHKKQQKTENSFFRVPNLCTQRIDISTSFMTPQQKDPESVIAFGIIILVIYQTTSFSSRLIISGAAPSFTHSAVMRMPDIVSSEGASNIS